MVTIATAFIALTAIASFMVAYQLFQLERQNTARQQQENAVSMIQAFSGDGVTRGISVLRDLSSSDRLSLTSYENTLIDLSQLQFLYNAAVVCANTETCDREIMLTAFCSHFSKFVKIVDDHQKHFGLILFAEGKETGIFLDSCQEEEVEIQ